MKKNFLKCFIFCSFLFGISYSIKAEELIQNDNSKGLENNYDNHSEAMPFQESNESLNLTVSPFPINLITEPGKTVSADLKIKNNNNHPEKLRVDLMKFGALEDTGKPIISEKEKGDDFLNWVKFSEEEFVLEANQWKTIRADFTPPENASFGYYYATVFSRVNEKTEEKKNKVVGKIAILVLLEVKSPNTQKKVEVVEFSSSKKIYEFLPVDFTVKLKNTGNVHLAPKGNIFINKKEEDNLSVLNVNQEGGGNILPGTPRSFNAEWNDGFPVFVIQTKDGKVVLDKKGNPKKKLQWDFSQFNKLRWGKYNAHLLMAYDDGSRDIPIEGDLNFWVIPWRIILALFVLLSLVLIGTQSIFKKIYRKIFKKNNAE